MVMPEILRNVIQEALEFVDCDAHHDLNLGYRHAIWLTFGPRMKVPGTPFNLGHMRRASLAILTAHQVLQIWEAVWPEDNLPSSLLEIAREVIKGKVSVESAKTFRRTAWAKLEQLASNPEYQEAKYQRSTSAGLSAECALKTVLEDEVFEATHIDYSLTDLDQDAYEHDASFWAATAYSGPIWEVDSDSSRRREFWVWWLNEAVSQAWEVFL